MLKDQERKMHYLDSNDSKPDFKHAFSSTLRVR